tara:strand:- start:1217 stop:3463 length:2247 start_codon:yes stop_codon:yes gene_type:complete
MINTKFAGFTLKQKHTLAKGMGFDGKASNKEIDNFINSNPQNSNTYAMYVNAAKNAVGGVMSKGRAEGMSQGGYVGYAEGGSATTLVDKVDNALKTPKRLKPVEDPGTFAGSDPGVWQHIWNNGAAGSGRYQAVIKNNVTGAQQASGGYYATKAEVNAALAPVLKSMNKPHEDYKKKKSEYDAKKKSFDAYTANAAEVENVAQEKSQVVGDISYAAATSPAEMATKTEVDTLTESKDQLIDKATGQVSGTPSATATTAAATTAGTPTDVATETISASAVADKTKAEADKATAAQGTISAGAQVSAAEGDASNITGAGTESISTITDPTQIVPPPARTVEEGEMISGSAVDMAAVKEATDIQAATADPSKRATVQGQLEGLMQDFEGGATPAWAAGAMRSATAQMVARGLGSSSMAAQAIVQAAMESALPIAQQDAQVFAQFEAQNLSNRQQTALFAAEQRANFLQLDFNQEFQARVTNAAKISDIANMNFTADQQIALENARLTQTTNLANMSATNAKVMADAAAMSQMDLANLSNEQQAAVQNAQNFLQMDMANLSNLQQTSMFKAQAVQQALLTDVAAENAAKQFNATSKNQANQFMASLKSQVDQFNTTQTNAMSQFNAGEKNALSKFNSEMQNQRDQFNATNTLVVAQANAQWRQNIATLNTSAKNEANMADAKFQNGFTENAINQIWQRERDMMAYSFTASESLKERNLKILIADKNLESVRKQLDAAEDSAQSEFWYRFLFS